VALETRINRKEAAREAKRLSFKSALVEIADRNQVVVGLLKGLSAKGKVARDHLAGDVQSGIEYLSNCPHQEVLLQQVDVPADAARYVLGAVHKVKGLVYSINKAEIVKALQYGDTPTSKTLDRLKYIHMILLQLGKVLLKEALHGPKEILKLGELLRPSHVVGNLDPDKVSESIAVYPPLGELRLPERYSELSFSNLIEEARKQEPEPVDAVLETREG
jgi:hypothetical protein